MPFSSVGRNKLQNLIAHNFHPCTVNDPFKRFATNILHIQLESVLKVPLQKCLVVPCNCVSQSLAIKFTPCWLQTEIFWIIRFLSDISLQQEKIGSTVVDLYFFKSAFIEHLSITYEMNAWQLEYINLHTESSYTVGITLCRNTMALKAGKNTEINNNHSRHNLSEHTGP